MHSFELLAEEHVILSVVFSCENVFDCIGLFEVHEFGIDAFEVDWIAFGSRIQLELGSEFIDLFRHEIQFGDGLFRVVLQEFNLWFCSSFPQKQNNNITFHKEFSYHVSPSCSSWKIIQISYSVLFNWNLCTSTCY